MLQQRFVYRDILWAALLINLFALQGAAGLLALGASAGPVGPGGALQTCSHERVAGLEGLEGQLHRFFLRGGAAGKKSLQECKRPGLLVQPGPW